MQNKPHIGSSFQIIDEHSPDITIKLPLYLHRNPRIKKLKITFVRTKPTLSEKYTYEKK
jgi:hypothetical protein